MHIRQIMEILPHRYPLLLVDRILELEPMRRASGYKNGPPTTDVTVHTVA